MIGYGYLLPVHGISRVPLAKVIVFDSALPTAGTLWVDSLGFQRNVAHVEGCQAGVFELYL